MLTIGAVSYHVEDGVLVVRGEYNVALQIGVLQHGGGGVWHVLSFEETGWLAHDPKALVEFAKDQARVWSEGQERQGFNLGHSEKSNRIPRLARVCSLGGCTSRSKTLCSTKNGLSRCRRAVAKSRPMFERVGSGRSFLYRVR